MMKMLAMLAALGLVTPSIAQAAVGSNKAKTTIKSKRNVTVAKKHEEKDGEKAKKPKKVKKPKKEEKADGDEKPAKKPAKKVKKVKKPKKEEKPAE